MKHRIFRFLPLTLALALTAHSPSAQRTLQWPAWSIEGDQRNARLGNSVSTAGDVNGDGYADLIVAAYAWNGVYTDEGLVEVFYGSAFGPALTPDWTLQGSQTGGQLYAGLGWAVATAGDVNGDGFDDVLVGVGPKHLIHKARLYMGSASGLATVAAWLGDATFAYAVSSAGDVNGDGFDDVIIANPQFTNDLPNEGRVLVYYGSPSGLGTSPNWASEGDSQYSLYGGSVACAGDVNGDGYGDILIGAPEFNNGQNNEGRAYLFLGSAAGLETTPVWVVESDQGSAALGSCVSSAGDVNGDGFDDVAVSASGYTNIETGEGRHFVYLGSPAGPSLLPDWTTESDQWGSGAGGISACDLDADGYSDLVVGYPAYDHPQMDEGRVFAYYGSPGGLGTQTHWTVEPNKRYSNFGFRLFTAGDTNGDGYEDVLVGAWTLDDEVPNEGAAFLYLGSHRRGRP